MGQRERSQIQRSRILDAMARVASRRGYPGASVASVCAEAGVSHHTFYEHFDTLEDCFSSLLDDGARLVVRAISESFVAERSWVDGARSALVASLSLFDRQPALARVLLVEVTAAGPAVRERREVHLAALTAAIERHCGCVEERSPHPFAAAGVSASLLGVLHTRLVMEADEPLISLLGPMMGLVTVWYLDPPAVRHEVELGERLAREIVATRAASCATSRGGTGAVPAALRDPRAHRARACLRYLVDNPGASNREVAAAVGIARHTQVSTLLARLERMDLLDKRAGAPGRPNAWRLTETGARAADLLKDSGLDLGRDSDGVSAGTATRFVPVPICD
jgi:AcrR family transcriptional regulator